ncbi:DUF5696 domain-containing protein [Cohnella sp.]|uniref:DUF5696 domain-containing protein n=1 Tax=Cohnella sp. TaxID=1883426 RepID=UPI0035663CE5
MKVRWVFTILTVTAVVIASLGIVHTDTMKAQKAEAPQASGTAGYELNGQLVLAGKTEQLTLGFNPQTAEIIVTDLSSGVLWSSNPMDRANDTIAKGIKKQDLNAQLLLDYVDPLNKPFQLNNFLGSIQEKAFTWKQIDNGVEVTFEFPKAGFTIPVLYSLKDDVFSATIATDRIEQKDKYRLVNINLLPFFGAGSILDEGYLFVPDGSGALIRFNNNKSIYKSYDERVYGGDQAIDRPELNGLKEDIRLPVFGLKRNDHAVLAVIHQGAYQAGIKAEVSRKNNQYNSVSSYLNMTEFETNILMAGSPSEKLVVRASQSLAGNRPFEIRYYFLNEGKADYAGMAERYRTYLTEDQGVVPFNWKSSVQAPLMLEFLGGIKKRDTFLGIPYRTVEALTTLGDLGMVADRLNDNGIKNLSIRYEGWMSGGMKDQVTVSPNAERKLGGDKAFRSLVQEMEQKGIAFYPVVDPVSFYKNGNGFNKFFDAAKNISRAPTLKYEFLASSGTKNKEVKPWYLLKPESVKEAVDRFSESAEDTGLKRAALQSIGSLVYSDFRRQTLTKNETGQIWEDSLKLAATRIEGLSFDHANAYTFPSAESLTSVPLFSSRFDIEDEQIPFYSIAVSGLLPAFGEPINLAGNNRTYLLKLLETGTFPTYKFIASNSSLLIGTEFDSLYSGDFNLWFEDMTAQYKEINQAILPVLGLPITEHEKISDGVYRTTFSSGKSIVVNYSEKAVTVDDEQIESNGYRVR